MKMDTFESMSVAGLFVTLPSATSSTTIRLVDQLVAMKLGLYRPGYRFSAVSQNEPFARSVLSQIVDQGFALHRMDRSFRVPAVTAH